MDRKKDSQDGSEDLQSPPDLWIRRGAIIQVVAWLLGSGCIVGLLSLTYDIVHNVTENIERKIERVEDKFHECCQKK